jgi:hypothetical protein
MTVPALALVMTTGGLERFTAAQLDDDVDLTITEVGLTAATFVVAPTLTALPGEFRRIDTLSGDQIGDNIIHLLVRDEAAVAYTVRGFGLFLADGTLFAVYGQDDPIVEKAIGSTTLHAIDIAFPTADINAITFGDTNFLNAPATTETAGVARKATQAEVTAGAAADPFVTPLTLRTLLAAWFGVGPFSTFIKEFLAVTTVAAARTKLGLGNVATRDMGTGNGIDADKLDGMEGAVFLRVTDSGGDSDGSWRAFSDGRLEQEGENLTTSGLDEPVVTVAMPMDFADTDYRIQLTPLLNAASDTKDTWIQLVRGSKTVNSFQVQFQRPGTSTSSFGLDGFEWTARGAGA